MCNNNNGKMSCTHWNGFCVTNVDRSMVWLWNKKPELHTRVSTMENRIIFIHSRWTIALGGWRHQPSCAHFCTDSGWAHFFSLLFGFQCHYGARIAQRWQRQQQQSPINQLPTWKKQRKIQSQPFFVAK